MDSRDYDQGKISNVIHPWITTHVWCEGAFRLIAKEFRKVVIDEPCSDENFNLLVGKIGILTSTIEWINKVDPVSIDGKQYLIRVMEEQSESIRLIPLFPLYC